MKHIIKTVTLVGILIAYMPVQAMDHINDNSDSELLDGNIQQREISDDNTPTADNEYHGEFSMLIEAKSRPQNNVEKKQEDEQEQVDRPDLAYTATLSNSITDSILFSETEHTQQLETINNYLYLTDQHYYTPQAHKDASVTLTEYEQDLFGLQPNAHHIVTLRNGSCSEQHSLNNAQKLQNQAITTLMHQCVQELYQPLQTLLSQWQQIITTDQHHTCLFDILINTATQWNLNPANFTASDYTHLMTLIDAQHLILSEALISFEQVIHNSPHVPKLAHIHLTYKDTPHFKESKKQIDRFLLPSIFESEECAKDYTNSPAHRFAFTLERYRHMLHTLATNVHYAAQQAQRLNNAADQTMSESDADTPTITHLSADTLEKRTSEHTACISTSLNIIKNVSQKNINSSIDDLSNKMGTLFDIYDQWFSRIALDHALYTPTMDTSTPQKTELPLDITFIQTKFETIKQNCIATLKQYPLSTQESLDSHLSDFPHTSDTTDIPTRKEMLLAQYHAVTQAAYETEQLIDTIHYPFSIKSPNVCTIINRLSPYITQTFSHMHCHRRNLLSLIMQLFHANSTECPNTPHTNTPITHTHENNNTDNHGSTCDTVTSTADTDQQTVTSITATATHSVNITQQTLRNSTNRTDAMTSPQPVPVSPSDTAINNANPTDSISVPSTSPSAASISAAKIGVITAGIVGGAYAAYTYLPTLISQIKTGQWRRWLKSKHTNPTSDARADAHKTHRVIA